jgi:cellulose synthase (UDP-forming)
MFYLKKTICKRIEDKMKFLKEFLYSFTIILTLVYIVFRIAFTLPINIGPVAIIFSIIVLLLEIWDAIDFTVYYMNILGVERKNKALPKIKEEDYPDVDVFVATINENEKVLTTTIEACKNMKYPDKKKVHIYICDD